MERGLHSAYGGARKLRLTFPPCAVPTRPRWQSPLGKGREGTTNEFGGKIRLVGKPTAPKTTSKYY